MKKQFTIRAFAICVTCLCAYLGLASRYGFARGLVCLVVLLQGVSSLLFFFTSYHSWQEDNHRNAMAALVLGVLVMMGALLLSFIVFQSPPIRPGG